MPNLLRRVAVLSVISAIGIAALAPLSVRSAPLENTVTDRLLDAADAPETSLRRSAMDGRELSASLTLLQADQPIGTETLGVAVAQVQPPPAAPMRAAVYAKPTPTPEPEPLPAVKPPPMDGNTITGRASWYCHAVGTCPAGYGPNDAFVALPGALGGAGGRGVVAHVTVCADRCVRLPVVDYCGCYWGTPQQRVADLSVKAWQAVSDTPTSAGVIRVTLHLEN